jgi:ankyrin repeat protein
METYCSPDPFKYFGDFYSESNPYDPVARRERLNLMYDFYNAIRRGNMDYVEYLHKKGAKVNDIHAICCAVMNGHLYELMYLHENGADITQWNNYAVNCAKANGQERIVEYLLANGAVLDTALLPPQPQQEECNTQNTQDHW